ncbi:SNF1-related protein kinase regulatory subunit gamma-like PV42a [Diospyros lotus]|uniref:SNF1-related protein kinase regulatory subunit gamma-like PV42a n=1 Tax=Diospyros lotus TaxID=55363 RepID=UPI002251B5E1|nr:SNF1-related protein kinase regulatory subunit gamma-like PV42a [Diospyros lotus]
MQATMEFKDSSESHRRRLRDKKVIDVLAPDKRRLVEVPYTASLADTMNALVANRVGAVPVAAPPGHWIGAGGSMILECDKQTGAVRKHYIGIVTMLDILAHIPSEDGGGGILSYLDPRMVVPVSSIIGHSLESLSLWTLNPNTSVGDCMEVFSKGIHRALVPLHSLKENVAGVELAESASTYRMLTQMDLLRFLTAHDSELKAVMSNSVAQLGGVTDPIFAVTNSATVIDTIKCMKETSLYAVPIVEASDDSVEDHSQLINGKGRKLMGTFSATDLRGCPMGQLGAWLHGNVLEFTEMLNGSSETGEGATPREMVTCRGESAVEEVVEKALSKHVHRVWVVEEGGWLDGVVSLTDVIRACRIHLLSES